MSRQILQNTLILLTLTHCTEFIFFLSVLSLLGTLANQATILQQSSWSKIFIGEEITLRCDIQDAGSTQWVYEWKTDISEQTAETKELRVVYTSVVNDEDYWCRGTHKIDSCSFTRWSYPIRLPVLGTFCSTLHLDLKS